MPYTGDLSNTIMVLRLNLGDTSSEYEILKDSDYQYFLDKYDGNERRATIDAARAILFALSSKTRERIDVLEIHGDQWASTACGAGAGTMSMGVVSAASEAATEWSTSGAAGSC